MRSVPPIAPEVLRAIFDGDSPAISPARQPRKGRLMRPALLLAALALSLVPPASADSRNAAPRIMTNEIERLVAPCRTVATLAFTTGETALMDAFVENLLDHPKRDREEIIACGAYLAGARDMAGGAILPIDVD